MSTHPLDRRRVKPFGRRLQLRRFAICALAVLLVFAAAFGIGHMNRSDGSVVERTPPPLPEVATPVPAALASAPTIKLAVVRPPPAPKRSAPATSSRPTATAPTVTAGAPVSPRRPSPAPTVTQPARNAREQTGRACERAAARPSRSARAAPARVGLGHLL